MAHELTVDVFDKDENPRWHTARGVCSCGWEVGCRNRATVEKEHAQHLREIEAVRYIVTVDGKEHVLPESAVRRVNI